MKASLHRERAPASSTWDRRAARGRRRRGTTFYELLTSLLLLAGVIAGVSQCMVAVARTTREAERFERAVELANITLERATAPSGASAPSTQVWDDQQITGTIYAIDLAADDRQPGDDGLSGQKVSVTVSWENMQGLPREVTLHAWHFSGDTDAQGGPDA